jgi:hypothetical protein
MDRSLHSARTIVVALACAGLLLSLAGFTPAWTQQPDPTRAQVFTHQPPQPPAEKKEPPKEEEKPFDEVVKDLEKIEGLFTFYRKADENKLLLEIKPDQFDKDYLYSAKTEQATGERGLYGTIMAEQYLFQFRRLGNRVQLVQRNTRFRAKPGSPEERAVRNSFTDSIMSSAKLASKPHLERKSVLVDANDIFLASDLHGIGQWLKLVYRTGYQFDKENSGFVLVKSFPLNSELGAQLRFAAGEYGDAFPSILADPRFITMRFRYSLVALPENDYRPRLADDRVGHFLDTYQDLSDQGAEVPYRRLVNRWHLKKKDPKAAVSEPVEPIVFWLENSIPVEYRNDFRDGVLLWNRAFEKAGFKNAIVVKQMPDDADWDPSDIRYNTIRWFAGYDASFAIGPSHSNPLTGQLLDADIGMSDAIIRFLRAEYREFTNPVQSWEDVERWMNGGLPLAALRRDPSRFCNFATEAAPRVALGYDLLVAQGAMSPDREAQYLRDWILELTAHEVGHTLGLRHNHRGSVINTLPQLHERARTQAVGVSNSVMEYNPANIAPKGSAQGDYFMTNVGAYDEWAIEYAYKPLPGAQTPPEEVPELRKIAARVAEPVLSYGTDEDSWFSPSSIDPGTMPWDFGSDNLAWFRQQFGLVKSLFANLEAKLEKPGENYEVLRRSFNRMQGEYFVAALGATKYIGGYYHYRDHVGDPSARLPYVPVPPARQREALAFLAKELWAPDAFQVQGQLLNKLALKRFFDFDFNAWTAARKDYPLHAVVLNLQTAPLWRLYHPVLFARLQDQELRATDPNDRFTLADLFTGIRAAIWSELDSGSNVNSFRRNLQRAHLNQLLGIFLRPPWGAPEDAVTLARADLVELEGRIGKALANSSLDTMTRAHLEESRARIRQALESKVEREF